MSEWSAGYLAAIGDLERLIETRFSSIFPTRFRKAVAGLLADLRADASIIDHEHLNRDQRAALVAEAAAQPVAQRSLVL